MARRVLATEFAIANATGIPLTYGEKLQVQRYPTGGEYVLHSDAPASGVQGKVRRGIDPPVRVRR